MGSALLALLTPGLLWQTGFFAMAVMVVVWLARLQRNPQNGINFIELVVDDRGRMDPVRVAYIVVLGVTTVGYVFFFMTVSMTAEGYTMATVAYAGIWVMSQGANRAIARGAPDAPPFTTTTTTAPADAKVQTTVQPKEGA